MLALAAVLGLVLSLRLPRGRRWNTPGGVRGRDLAAALRPECAATYGPAGAGPVPGFHQGLPNSHTSERVESDQRIRTWTSTWNRSKLG
jgi:hypothetical protein